MTSVPNKPNQVANTDLSMWDSPAGDYRVLAGGPAYCTGIVPNPGFEVVRVQLQTWLPLDRAYSFIERHIEAAGRPIQAFCGIEMRVPKALTRDDWSTFNGPYLNQLRRWGLMHGELSGVCRSNIALADHAPQLPSVCAFSFVAPTISKERGFCLSGTADIASDGTIIADGRTDSEAMRERARYTIDVIGSSLKRLGLSWANVNQLAIFHVHEIPGLWDDGLLGAVGEPLRQGVIRYQARPPIEGGEVELEARGARREYILVP